MKRRDLTPDEEKLWSAVTSSDKPLPRRKRIASPSPLVGEGGMAGKSQRVRSSNISIHTPLPTPLPQGERVLKQGSTANIDRNTADRFRKGELPMDAILDLHGMNRERAYNALMRCIRSQYERGSRCVLVITGKGVKRTDDADDRGILRELLPAWLDVPDIRPMILAFSVAKPKHGGSGAFYVLLKRKRQSGGT